MSILTLSRFYLLDIGCNNSDNVEIQKKIWPSTKSYFKKYFVLFINNTFMVIHCTAHVTVPAH